MCAIALCLCLHAIFGHPMASSLLPCPLAERLSALTFLLCGGEFLWMLITDGRNQLLWQHRARDNGGPAAVHVCDPAEHFTKNTAVSGSCGRLACVLIFGPCCVSALSNVAPVTSEKNAISVSKRFEGESRLTACVCFGALGVIVLHDTRPRYSAGFSYSSLLLARSSTRGPRCRCHQLSLNCTSCVVSGSHFLMNLPGDWAWRQTVQNILRVAWMDIFERTGWTLVSMWNANASASNSALNGLVSHPPVPKTLNPRALSLRPANTFQHQGCALIFSSTCRAALHQAALHIPKR